ncbi:hypothetical protein [Thioalkalivibrio paradoxus]|uniref:Uncharacterized protein n=1 Tax=Thioalkalivibrio paradoxus ARh 1 TaxID=713585 RepID=W0DN14_9GAMM|nr:hypothetical protein [Thioalkalivibrio paradoxus]AHE99841.1 hypothetical protein THITH_01565 [Thioalkalivibrio paradoxus ARh 1]
MSDKTRERKAGELWARASRDVESGDSSLWRIALHIQQMVEGVRDFPGPLWRDREVPPDWKRVHLDRFEDYLLKPPREGIGVPSLLRLHNHMQGHDEGERAIEILRREIPDYDARIQAERMRAVKPVARPGGTGANQHTVDKSKGANGTSAQVKAPKPRGTNSRDHIIGRLKRDAREDPKAKEVLARVEKGEVSARAAGIEMGWVKPADPARIVEKQVERLSDDEVVDLYKNLARSLPEAKWNHLEAAKEAVMALSDDEMAGFEAWYRSLAGVGGDQ